MPKQKTIIAASIVVALLIVGVSWLFLPDLFSHKSVVVLGFPPISYPEPGFHTWPTPRDYDGPGTVFTTNESRFDAVGKLSEPVLIGNEALPIINKSDDWKTGVLEDFLGKAIDFKGDSNAVINTEFSAVGVQRWGVKDFGNTAKEFKQAHEKDDLYLIVEAVSVDGITYKTKRTLLANSKGDLNKSGIGTVTLDESASGTDEIEVKQKFDKPYY